MTAESQQADLASGNDAYAHLSNDEAAILSRQVDSTPTVVKYTSLFRYATTIDRCLLAGSTLSAIAAGASLPLMTIIYGSLAGTVSCICAPKLWCNVLTVCIVPRVFPRHCHGLVLFARGQSIDTVLCLPRHWPVCHDLPCHGRFQLCWRTHHCQSPRTLSRGCVAPKHGIFRPPWSGRNCESHLELRADDGH